MAEILNVFGKIDRKSVVKKFGKAIKPVTVENCPYCGETHVHYYGSNIEDDGRMLREALCLKGDYMIYTKWIFMDNLIKFCNL